MGRFPARIEAQDFVTPPEFAQWRLAAEGSGRIGGARLTLKQGRHETEVADLYEQIPIRVFPVKCGPRQPLLVYLANPTAGLMDGDAHCIQIHAEAGTRAIVTGQSATRIHPCVNGFCTQQWLVTVADNAVMVVMPGPNIPFAGCRFFQRVRIELGKNARLVWTDLWFAGRYARGDASEQFRFEWINQDMEVLREGQLVYRDRFAWHGPWTDEIAHWHFGGHPAVGSMFAAGPPTAVSPLHNDQVDSAAFLTAAGDTCTRWKGPSEALVSQSVRCSLESASASDSTDAAWLLDGHHLAAATHWFSL